MQWIQNVYCPSNFPRPLPARILNHRPSPPPETPSSLITPLLPAPGSLLVQHTNLPLVELLWNGPPVHDVVTTYHYAGDTICQTSLNLCHGVVVGYLSVLPHSLPFITSDKGASMTERRNAATQRNTGPPGRKETTLAGLPGPVSTQSQLCHYLLSTSRDFATEKICSRREKWRYSVSSWGACDDKTIEGGDKVTSSVQCLAHGEQ